MVYLLHALLRPRRPRGGRGAARSAARATPTSRASSAPSTSRRPTGCRFFMFTYFTDRDGKFQLARARRERLRPAGAHLPLHADRGSAPHVRRRDRASARVVQRTCELMNELSTDDPTTCAPPARSTCRRSSATSTSTTRCRSTCSAPRCRPTPPTSTRTGLKGRFEETQAATTTIVLKGADLHGARASRTASSSSKDVPTLNALNEVLRDDYIKDSPARRRPLEQGASRRHGIDVPR